MEAGARPFDLNVETVLENWHVSDAIREIIANAIDEELLTSTGTVDIFENQDGWHIRDSGRGLHYTHLTQNENEEKLAHPTLVIGKFGVGLKDALAVLDRRKVGLAIRSRHGDVAQAKLPKKGFPDVHTLHAVVSPPADPAFVGTEFVLKGVSAEEIDRAKSFFLRYSGDLLLETTRFGQVLARGTNGARIYVNGVKVAEEERFLFSYNITSLTKKMRSALNRERTHVGRTAYVDRVKDILLACRGGAVAEPLVHDLQQFDAGQSHDEVTWVDIATHACKLLNAAGKVVFFTPSQLLTAAGMVDRAIGDGYKVVTIPESVREKISGLTDISGKPVVDLEEYTLQWNRSFQFRFVPPEQLTPSERQVFAQTDRIFRLAGGKPDTVQDVLISENMRLEGFQEANGVWEPHERRIVVKRSQLQSFRAYAATLLHEIGHSLSGAPDISRPFEDALTRLLGTVANNAMG